MHKDCQSNEPFLRQQFCRKVTMNVYYIDVQNLTVKLNFQSWDISLLHMSKLCIPDYRRKKNLTPTTTNEMIFYTISNFGKKKRLSWLKEEMHATSVYLCLQTTCVRKAYKSFVYYGTTTFTVIVDHRTIYFLQKYSDSLAYIKTSFECILKHAHVHHLRL